MRKINFFLFLFFHCICFSQSKDKIIIKQQDQIYFYQLGDVKDSIIIKNSTDLFLLKMSDDKKKIVEVKLKNATFVKTNEENIFKLIFVPGMNYRMIYATSAEEGVSGVNSNSVNSQIKNKPYQYQIATDGANVDGSKEIVIQLIDTKTEKVLITNTFSYKEK